MDDTIAGVVLREASAHSDYLNSISSTLIAGWAGIGIWRAQKRQEGGNLPPFIGKYPAIISVVFSMIAILFYVFANMQKIGTIGRLLSYDPSKGQSFTDFGGQELAALRFFYGSQLVCLFFALLFMAIFAIRNLRYVR